MGLIVRYGWRYPLALASILNVFKHGKKAATLRPLFASIPFLPRQDYDIIHCQFGVHALLGLELRSMGILQGKLISTFRGFDISEYIRRCGNDVYRHLFHTGDLFLTNCEFFRQRLIELGCESAHIHVHYSSIDCQRFTVKPRMLAAGDAIRVVTVGRLVEKKGIEYGIRAIAQLFSSYPHLHYTIIGDGPLREALTALIHDLELESVVTLVGWKQQDEVVDILDQSHILVAPSVTAESGDQDAPVNTLKEAMAMGLPVIGTCHGGIPELIEDGVSGLLVPERDAGAIATALNHLIRHADQWPTMGQAGRQRIEEHFDMAVLNQELINIYRRLLNSPPHSVESSIEMSRPPNLVT